VPNLIPFALGGVAGVGEQALRSPEPPPLSFLRLGHQQQGDLPLLYPSAGASQQVGVSHSGGTGRASTTAPLSAAFLSWTIASNSDRNWTNVAAWRDHCAEPAETLIDLITKKKPRRRTGIRMGGAGPP